MHNVRPSLCTTWLVTCCGGELTYTTLTRHILWCGELWGWRTCPALPPPSVCPRTASVPAAPPQSPSAVPDWTTPGRGFCGPGLSDSLCPQWNRAAPLELNVNIIHLKNQYKYIWSILTTVMRVEHLNARNNLSLHVLWQMQLLPFVWSNNFDKHKISWQ